MPRFWVWVVLTAAVIIGGVVMVAAFTSQTVNITARVEQPPTIVKYPLTPPPVTQAEVDAMTLDAIGVTGCQPGELEFPYEAPTGTCVWWALRVSVRNNYYDPLIDLAVKDTFVGERDGITLSEVPVKVSPLGASQGQVELTELTDQVQIDWCLTGSLQDGACTGGGRLDPGAEAHLDLLVFTKPDLEGQQEFVSPGTYTLNGGPSAEWVDPNGVVCAPLAECPTAQPMIVEAVSGPDQPAAPLAPAPTSAPTSTPTSAPPPAPTPTPTLTPTITPTPTPTPLS